MRARVEKHIDFFQHDFFDSIPDKIKDERPGKILINLPYDERLSVDSGLEAFIKDVVHKVRKDYKKWDVYFLAPASVDSFRKELSFSKSSKMLNGAIEVRLVRL